MPNGQPIGRAGKKLCAHGQNWAGLSQGKNFRAGLGGPKDTTIRIRAGWAAHFLMGFSYGRELKCLTDLRIRVGPTFYFDKASSLTSLEIILVQSVNLFMMKYPS